MRMVQGSMTDAVRPRRATAGRGLAKAAAGAPALHALSLQAGVGRAAQRGAAQALQAAAAWPWLAFDPAAQREAGALAWAAGEQWLAVQRQWVDGLDEVVEEAGELRGVNTMTKLVAQQMNLLQLGLAFFASQTTAAVRTAENIQNNVAFWASRKAGGALP